MKEIKVRNLSLIILSIILMFCLTTNVLATDYLVDVTSNSTGKTNTTNTANNTDLQNITQIDTPTFSAVTQTVYAKNNTNIKSSYSTTASNLGKLTKDQSIKRTGVSSDNVWSRVEMSNGTMGYVLSSDLTTTVPTTTINNTNTSVYNNNTNNNTNTLPQTGIGDNTGMYIIMGICVISAIYAYKKIRDYNI